MRTSSKSFSLVLLAILVISSAEPLIVGTAFALSRYPHVTPETDHFTYVVSNYPVNYSIIEQTPSAGGNYTGYNLVVYGNYPPFPIEISFNDGTQKVTANAPADAYSTSIVSINYPTQITMTKASASTPPSPAVPELFPIIILPLIIAAMLLALTLASKTKVLKNKKEKKGGFSLHAT